MDVAELGSGRDAVLYVHGRGGSAKEAEHYAPLFPSCAVIGLDYAGQTPWEAGAEIRAALTGLKAKYDRVTLIANSIGAFFSMNAGIGGDLDRAFFISPVVDMEKLITGMMAAFGVTEAELREKGVISTPFGEELSWEYLRYVREHPVEWNVPTEILYGSADDITPFDTIDAFAKAHRSGLTVMENGEHWFHTEEQVRFLDDWIKAKTAV
ncbi:MAG: alpha/beta hydrolase [Oscillospiraceae bacterium]|nr:alpha/beta hydrolase [Oscillospiraceae bacterium]